MLITQVTQTDVTLLLESVNRQLQLDGSTLRLKLEITKARKIALYRLLSDTNRDVSGAGEAGEIYNCLRSIQSVLQLKGL